MLRKRLQKTVTLALILCLSISSLLYLFFDVAQLRFKGEAQENIRSDEQLQVIKLSLQDFRNRKGSDEVWVNGNLYDISSYTIVNGEVFVTVFHDSNEESLVKNIADSFEPNDKYCGDNIVHVCRHRIHLPDDVKILPGRHTICFAGRANKFEVLPYFNDYYSVLNNAVIKPPPKCVFA